MKETIILQSNNGGSQVVLEKGELISFQKEGVEYIHQKGDKGWNNSDTEMFPIIGPTIKNKHIVSTKKGNAILDQHGLLREFDYVLASHTTHTAEFSKRYIKHTPLKNRKFPKKSLAEHVFWPYDFHFKKKINLSNETLSITFEIHSEKNMPYMLGYHPAFKLSGLGNETLSTSSKKINLDAIFSVGADALPLLNTSQITLHNSNKKDVQIETKGFDHFMLWTEENNMLCIEPITHFPDLSTQKYSEDTMLLNPGQAAYSVEIKIT